MSKVIRTKSFHVWKYLGDDTNFSGYHFYLGLAGCEELLAGLADFSKKALPVERLVIKLSPVTDRVLRSVNNRNIAAFSFSALKLRMCEQQDYREGTEILEIDLESEDLELFIKALRATQEGLGDFSILDAPAWFWPVMT